MRVITDILGVGHFFLAYHDDGAFFGSRNEKQSLQGSRPQQQ